MRGVKIRSTADYAALAVVHTGRVTSAYKTGWNSHAVAGDATSIYTGHGTTLSTLSFRDSITWNDVERSSGVFDWLGAKAIKDEAVIDAMAGIGARPILIISSNSGTAPTVMLRRGQ